MLARTLAAALLIAFGSPAFAEPKRDTAATQYLALIENFVGGAESKWNANEQCFVAQGRGVTWARGNGDVCLCYALLLAEHPERAEFSSKKISRQTLLEHLRLALRTHCFRNKNCTHKDRAAKPNWGGPTWQAALETTRVAWAAQLAVDELDADTKALVRQVTIAEAEAARKTIPDGKPGDTANDDCVWNTSLLGVAAAFCDDDRRAPEWDEWCKLWALNAEARDLDRKSPRVVDGKPLGEWLRSTNVFEDFTLENHGFWSVPYQADCEEVSVAALAYKVRAKKIPEALTLHAKENGDILRWLTLVDGDLLAPHGQDWAPRDFQHAWAFAWLGYGCDQAWARAAEARALDMIARRQKAFGDGSLHALDFGYETDLAVNWCFSFLLHKHFEKPADAAKPPELLGTRIFPHVKVAISRTAPLVSSVSWHAKRPAVMIVPNDAAALGDFPSFTDYAATNGLGWIKIDGKPKLPAFRVGKPKQLEESSGQLLVSFDREISRIARQEIACCQLPTGEVLVFSRWRALADIAVAELVDHPFRWVEVPGFLPERRVESGQAADSWIIDGKLQLQVLGGACGKVEKAGVLGSVRAEKWEAKAGKSSSDLSP